MVFNSRRSIIVFVFVGATIASFLLYRSNFIVFTSGPHTVLASDGIIWLLPWEKGHYSDGRTFSYQGQSVSASEKGGSLVVNGKPYCIVTTGDTVDLSNNEVVLVNGQSKSPF